MALPTLAAGVFFAGWSSISPPAEAAASSLAEAPPKGLWADATQVGSLFDATFVPLTGHGNLMVFGLDGSPGIGEVVFKVDPSFTSDRRVRILVVPLDDTIEPPFGKICVESQTKGMPFGVRGDLIAPFSALGCEAITGPLRFMEVETGPFPFGGLAVEQFVARIFPFGQGYDGPIGISLVGVVP